MGRCPDAEPLEAYTLRHYRLTFRGVADIEMDKGNRIHGGLYLVTPKCLQALDRFEGVASKIYQRQYVSVEVAGIQEVAVTYRMVPYSSGVPLGYGEPYPDYFRHLLTGYQEWSLPIDALNSARDRVKNVSREHRRYYGSASRRTTKRNVGSTAVQTTAHNWNRSLFDLPTRESVERQAREELEADIASWNRSKGNLLFDYSFDDDDYNDRDDYDAYDDFNNSALYITAGR